MKKDGFLHRLIEGLVEHPIRTFAVICVAAIATALWFMSDRLLDTLVSPNWCAAAIQAEKISPGTTFVGLTTCVELLKIQLGAVAIDSHIVTGAFAFSLIVLMVIVVARGKASGEVGPTGMKWNIGDAADAAKETAGAAVDKANEIAAAEPPKAAPPPDNTSEIGHGTIKEGE